MMWSCSGIFSSVQRNKVCLGLRLSLVVLGNAGDVVGPRRMNCATSPLKVEVSMNHSQFETRWFSIALHLHWAILLAAMAAGSLFLILDPIGAGPLWMQVVLAAGSAMFFWLAYETILVAATNAGFSWGRQSRFIRLKREPAFGMAIIMFVMSFCALIPLGRNPQLFGIWDWFFGIGVLLFFWSFAICEWCWSSACNLEMNQSRNDHDYLDLDNGEN